MFGGGGRGVGYKNAQPYTRDCDALWPVSSLYPTASTTGVMVFFRSKRKKPVSFQDDLLWSLQRTIQSLISLRWNVAFMDCAATAAALAFLSEGNSVKRFLVLGAKRDECTEVCTF